MQYLMYDVVTCRSFSVFAVTYIAFQFVICIV